VTRLEEITYETARAALADQESLVSGIRQRTGTLLAAQALVASFFGGAAIESKGFDALTWMAVAVLAAGLVLAVGVLAPWRLEFSFDARDIYWRLNAQAKKEAAEDTLGWLATVGFTYEEMRRKNMEKVLLISRMSAALGVVMIVQTLLWILVLGLLSSWSRSRCPSKRSRCFQPRSPSPSSSTPRSVRRQVRWRRPRTPRSVPGSSGSLSRRRAAVAG
jgi:hypothetical protein